MSNYTERVTEYVIAPEGKALYSVQATRIGVVDEAAGEFVVIKQDLDDGEKTIAIDPQEWPALRRVINRMIKQCRSENEVEL